MNRTLLLAFLCLFLALTSFSQDNLPTVCRQKEVMDRFYREHPEYRKIHDQIEGRLRDYNLKIKTGVLKNERTNAVVTLPVVVHIIHNNGPENISNVQVFTAIQHLNEAYANSGYYDPTDGVNTNIQFCLASRDPNGNATNGIDRVVSPLTVMDGSNNSAQDLAVKNLTRWNPLCYINIWVVKDIAGGVVGYAYLPSAHGSNVDGIVLEAGYFGTTFANDVVVTHEMGHYLGLYHTFEGGCTNTNCSIDGDRVCDTPPDQSTAYINCNTSMNSCSTDALSGFSTDVNDLTQDYMDYGNFNCMKVFTQGQSDRMNWFVQNVLNSLLACKSCLSPCPTPIVAGFTSSAHNISVGTTVNFTNSSVNASGYQWYLNGVPQTTSANWSNIFNTTGTYIIRLTALSGSALCDSSYKLDTIYVTCPVTAAFTPLTSTVPLNTTVNFTNTSTGSTIYNWYINDVLQSTATNYSRLFLLQGNYAVKLVASNGNCKDSLTGYVTAIDTTSTNPTPVDTCIQKSSYEKTYGGSNNDYGTASIPTKDGGYIVVGYTASFGAGAYDGIVTKFDKLGVIQWSKNYGAGSNDVLVRIIQTADGGYMVGGYTSSFGNSAGDAWMTKLDASGNVTWSKKYGDGNPNGERLDDLIQTSDGGYAFCGDHKNTPGVVDVMVVRTDAAGNVLWAKGFDSGGSDESYGIIEDRDSLVVTAFFQSGTYYDGVLMKMNKTTGAIIWIRSWDLDNRTNRFGNIWLLKDGYLIGGVNSDGFGTLNPYQVELKTDFNGNLIFANELRTTPNTMNGYSWPTSDGGYVIENEELDTDPNADLYLTKVGADGTVTWTKRYPQPNQQSQGGVFQSNDGNYVMTGSTNSGGGLFDILHIKTDVNGNTAGCTNTTVVGQNRNPVVTNLNFNWGSQYDIAFNAQQTINITSSDNRPVTNNLCQNIPCVVTPPDSCGLHSSFVKIIGGNGDDQVYDIKATADGGNIIAGSTNSQTGTTFDGLIIKTDYKGQIIWSKTYGGTGTEAFYRIIQTRDKNYVAVGYGQFSQSPPWSIFVVKVDQNGNLIWSRVFSAGSQFGDVGHSVVETDDGGLAIAADYNIDPAVVQSLYFKLDQNGNLLWSRLMQQNNACEAYDIVAQGDFLMGTGVVSRVGGGSTFNDGYMIKLRSSDGALVWTKNYESEGRSNRLEQFWLKNNTLIANMRNSDSWVTGNTRPLIIVADTSSGTQFQSNSYDIQGIDNNSLLTWILPTSDGGYLASVSELKNNTSPRLVKINANGSINWSKSYSNYYSQTTAANAENSFGYTTASTIKKLSGSSSDILLIKTDTAGLMLGSSQTPGNCPVTNTNATDAGVFTVSTVWPPSYWSSIGAANIQQTVPTLIVAPITLNVETPCIDTSPCVIPIPPVDSCAKGTFQSVYKDIDTSVANPRPYFYDMDVLAVKDGGIIHAGYASTATNSGLASLEANIYKTDNYGRLIWGKQLSFSSNYSTLQRIKENSDGTLITTGQVNVNNNRIVAHLTKFDAIGNVIWSRQFYTGSFNGDNGTDVVQTSDGGYAFCGGVDYRPGLNGHWLIVKTDANGNLVWSQVLDNSAIGERASSIVENGDTLMVSGDIHLATHYEAVVVKLNKLTGAVYSSKRYQVDNRSSSYSTLAKLPSGGYYLSTLATDNNAFANTQHTILKLTPDLNIQNGIKMSVVDPGLVSIAVTSDGGVAASGTENKINPAMTLYKFDPGLALTWGKQYAPSLNGSLYGYASATKMNLLPKGYVITGYHQDFSVPTYGGTYTVGTDSAGSTGSCLSSPATGTYSDVLIVSNNYTWTHSFPNIPFQAPYTLNPITRDVLPSLTILCNTDSCTSVKLDGPDSVCTLKDSVTYYIHRNKECHSRIVPTLSDTTFGSIVFANDSTIRIKFRKQGNVWLKVGFPTACKFVQDSLYITVLNSPDSLNAGPDIFLCKISSFTLHATPGFKSYVWTGGGTDSTYTVFTPGTYMVTATDYCNKQYTDTVIVSQAPDVPFDLGPDLVKCNNDTLTITAPAGFTKYYWSPNYRISNVYTPSIKVNPDKDTTYVVTAEFSAGCIVIDTIHVKVNVSPPVKLGNDTSFCKNDSILIDAGPGFSSYLWSTGAVSQEIIAKAKGQYWVAATASNNCTSRDTLVVTNVYNLPNVNLGPDTLVCMNGVVVFNAGAGYSSYLWQDGSSDNKFTATQPGTYWVQVVTVDQCLGADTVQILGFKDPPAGFLKDTAQLCDGGKITLQATDNFIKYLWSNNSITPTITITSPGSYWLEVTDAGGCKGRDTIEVYPNDCGKVLYFPNAFTPNGDAHNNVFRPIVFGILEKYKLIIFNRWGERIFETSDPYHGWDGTFGGKTQDTNTFVWMCTYKFAGATQRDQMQKGTATLIR